MSSLGVSGESGSQLKFSLVVKSFAIFAHVNIFGVVLFVDLLCIP